MIAGASPKSATDDNIKTILKNQEVLFIMKKRIVSLFLIISVLTSLFAVSAVSTSAASKPATPSVTIANGGSSQGLYVTWKKVANNAVYTIAYRPVGNYRSGQGYTYRTTANTNITLTGLTSGVCYQVQVRARVNGVYGNYSYTKSMTFLSRPLLRDYLDDDREYLVIAWNSVRGANSYQLVRWNVDNRRWDTVYNGNSVKFTDRSVKAGESYRYQVRAMYKTQKNGTAYSMWSNVDYPIYYPKITVNASRKKYIYGDFLREVQGLKRFYYEVEWKVRNNTSTQRYEIRFKNNLNSDKVLKTVTTKGKSYSFYTDDQYDYVCIRYLNILGSPVGSGEWVKLKTSA